MVEAADTAYADAAAAGLERPLRSWSTAASVLVVALIVGAILGAVIGGGSAGFQADAQVSISPDSAVDANLYPNALQLDTTTYIQGELLRLNGPGFASEVERRLGASVAPSFSFAQVDQTAIVSITATADSGRQARAVVAAALAQYRQLRSNSLSSTISAAAAENDQQLRAVQQQLRTATAASGTRAALQTQYTTLLGTQSTLKQDRLEIGSVVTSVQATRVSTVASSAATSALLGAVAVALLALLALLVTRRLRPTVGTLRGLSDLGLPVHLPAVPLVHDPRSELRAQVATRALARQLAAVSGGGPIVITGAGAGVGASFVAQRIADAFADAGCVLVTRSPEAVRASRFAAIGPPVPLSPVVGYDLGAGSPRSCLETTGLAMATGRPVVVDAPPLSVSDAALRILDRGAVVLLVVGRGRSHPLDVYSAAQLLGSVSNGPGGHGTPAQTDGPGRRGDSAAAALNDVPQRSLLQRVLHRRRPPAGAAVEPTPGDFAWADVDPDVSTTSHARTPWGTVWNTTPAPWPRLAVSQPSRNGGHPRASNRRHVSRRRIPDGTLNP